MPKGWPHIESKTDAEKEGETRPKVAHSGRRREKELLPRYLSSSERALLASYGPIGNHRIAQPQ